MGLEGLNNMENKQVPQQAPQEKHPARKFTPQQIAEAEKVTEEIEREKIIPEIAAELELMRLGILKKYGTVNHNTGMLDIKKESDTWNQIQADPEYKEIEKLQELKNKNSEEFVKRSKKVLKIWLTKQGVELKYLEEAMKNEKHTPEGKTFKHLTESLRKINNITQEVENSGIKDRAKVEDWEKFKYDYQKATISMWKIIEQNNFYKTRVKPVSELKKRMKTVRELTHS